MVIADTSAWIDHLRNYDAKMARCLSEGQLLMHPMVAGELACGNLSGRTAFLRSLQKLPQAITATHSEVMRLIESKAIFGRGLVLVDCHLLAAALLNRCGLLTRDGGLLKAAQELGLRTE